MKYCIIIPDGAADFALRELDGKTPLGAAEKPHMDRAAREGLLGTAATVPRRMAPGSDVAIMSMLGYDPVKCYTGRAPLEAADIGIQMKKGQWAFRCNFITVQDHLLKDFSAGHITTAEADRLIQDLNVEFGDFGCVFHTGTGYRHLMLYDTKAHLEITTNPPHQVIGQPLFDLWPEGDGAKGIIELMEMSRDMLKEHEVNKVREDKGLMPANMIWLWGQGRPVQLENFKHKYGIQGGVISAVNLVKGIAKLIGWDIITVPGITGYLDTDYAAKGQYAVDALSDSGCDLVVVHIEAPDEASHEGNARAKVKAIEEIDKHIVGPVMEYGERKDDLRVLIMPDHPTSVETKRHVRGKVPLAVWGAGIHAASGLSFTENKASETEIEWDKGYELMHSFLE